MNDVVQGGNQIKTRKRLSASGLIQTMRSGFERIPDHRADNTKISLADALMSGFAMYSLKDVSLLEFDKRRAKDRNLRRIYGLQNIPSESQMRTILDPIQPSLLGPYASLVLHLRICLLGRYFLRLALWQVEGLIILGPT